MARFPETNFASGTFTRESPADNFRSDGSTVCGNRAPVFAAIHVISSHFLGAIYGERANASKNELISYGGGIEERKKGGSRLFK